MDFVSIRGGMTILQNCSTRQGLALIGLTTEGMDVQKERGPFIRISMSC